MRSSQVRSVLPFLIALAALACTSSRTPPPVEPAAAPVVGEAPASVCTTDTDCDVARYPDPAVSGGCCEGLCDRPVVTRAEAERRQTAWEAACRAVRCRGACGDADEPQVACRGGRCVSP
jgi:hypothetical protein